MSHETISDITDCVLEQQQEWQNRPLKECCPFVFVDCMYVTLRKDYKAFTSQLKKLYGAPSVKASRAEFEKLKQTWSAYPGAIDVWERNYAHVEQMYDYGSAVRKIMYTTNAVESIHSSFRKVVKQGAFPNETALLKVLYLRITELYKKWEGGHAQNWAMVRNQLDMDPKIQARIRKYERV